ncbi:MAG: lytic transglycosylase domain-containing protein [Tissierellia bacterium]|nr:lytic transglycosylase domain-containing protein [Tissierellia bacterium]
MRVLTKIIIFLLIVILIVTGIVFASVYFSLDRQHEAYVDLIEKYSQEEKLNEELLAAIIKVESRFRPEAKSHAGAVGLMQLLPETAGWMADKMDMEFKEEDLLNPEINIKLGSAYFKYLFDTFKSEDLAILAYNGGPGNVNTWLENGTIDNDQASYENVPIYETRTYLTRIKDNRDLYNLVWKDVLKESGDSQFLRTYKFIKKIIASYF